MLEKADELTEHVCDVSLTLRYKDSSGHARAVAVIKPHKGGYLFEGWISGTERSLEVHQSTWETALREGKIQLIKLAEEHGLKLEDHFSPW